MAEQGVSVNSQTSALVQQVLELVIGILPRASRIVGSESRSAPIILRLDLSRFHRFYLTPKPTDLMLQEVFPFFPVQIKNPTCRTTNQDYC